MKKSISKSTRIILGVIIPGVLIAGAIFLYNFGSPLPCILRSLTGLLCPGCGSGRATTALLHLDFISAFNYNPLFVILLPFMIYAIIKYYILLVSGKDILKLSIPNSIAVILTVAILGFGVLRNINM